MAFCSFDEGAAMYDSTPVDNMFITEYMLHAPGDFVKVYIYALMLCYHEQQFMSLERMARDLDMTEEEVEQAFRYWERYGLARRTGDNPVRYSLRSAKQVTLARAENPGDQLYNRWFTEEVRRILGDHIFGEPDYDRINTWIETFELPEEVVLELLKKEVERLGEKGRFSFRVADKIAKEWADRNVRTLEDVQNIIVVGKERERELRGLLTRLGQRRNPSDDEKAMYTKWRDEWGFDADAIQEACRETTKGAPTMAYLDGILLRQHQLGRHGTIALKSGLAKDYSERDFIREVYAGLGRTGVSPTKDDAAAVAGWLADGFTQPMILLAVREAHMKSGSGNLEDVEHALSKWRKQGFTSVEQIEAARACVRMLNAQLREVYAAAGLEKRVNQADRDLLARWAGEMGFGMELILLAAQYARGNGAPMMVMDRILADWQRAGVATEQAAREEHERHVQGRTQKAPTRAPEAMQRHQYTDDDYRRMIVNLDEEEGS